MKHFGRILRCAAAVLTTGSCLSAGPARAAPPSGLLGKSVVMTWTEDIMSRPVGTAAFKSYNHNVSTTMYVSTAGRIFFRQHRAGTGGGFGRRGGRSGGLERAPGDAQPTGVKMARTDFRGNQMISTAQFESGARQIVVTFATGFSSCSADVRYGREGGQRRKVHSPVTGEWIEIESVTVRSVQCSMSEGPAF
jgi:hypothetical protein